MKIYGQPEKSIRQAVASGDVTIAVCGLGKMGLPLAAVFADAGARVIGADIDEGVVRGINQGICHVTGEPGLPELVERNVGEGRLSATSDLVHAAEEADVMVILVPTLLDRNNNPDMSIVRSVCAYIAKGLNPGDFVIQESTVPPGTTRDMILPILEESGHKIGDFGVAHCPERTSSGRAIIDITGAYPKIVGGVDSVSTETARALYLTINKKGVIAVSDATAAESVKVFEGLYRDVNIALANELAMVCDELGIDAREVFDAANTQPYSHIHAPGCGVGGHCIPVYPYFIINTVEASTDMLRLARRINDGMPAYTVDLLEDALQEIEVGLSDARVLLLGVTYRGDVNETRFSPAIDVINELKRRGAEVFAYDPVLGSEVQRFGAIPFDLGSGEGINEIDAILIASDHAEFKEIDWDLLGRLMRHKVVVDGRGILDPEELRSRGYLYRAVGRP
ncbi:MAG: nucleotide sugar dehydrogenase [Methanosarcinales archaeon]|nr:nucleotide sugar dehydrogenase [Methanosarcinales archaeon]